MVDSRNPGLGAFDVLLGGGAPPSASWRWGVVEATWPLRVRLDGETHTLETTPVDLEPPHYVGDRVLVALIGGTQSGRRSRRVVILGPPSRSAPLAGIVRVEDETAADELVLARDEAGHPPTPADPALVHVASRAPDESPLRYSSDGLTWKDISLVESDMSWNPPILATTTNPTMSTSPAPTGWWRRSGDVVEGTFMASITAGGNGHYHLAAPFPAASASVVGAGKMRQAGTATFTLLLEMTEANLDRISFYFPTSGNDQVTHVQPASSWPSGSSFGGTFQYRCA